MRLLWNIVKLCKLDKIVFSFIMEYIIVSILITFIEPNIDTITDGFWFTFVASTSIGFGDIVPVTALGRILTAIMTLHEIIIVSIIPGIVVNYYQDAMQVRYDESVANILDELERLPEMSEEELKKLSQKIKKRRYSN